MSEELAWAAALLVGEGWVGIQRTRQDGTGYLGLGIQMNDHRAVERFAAAIGPYLPDRRTRGYAISGCTVNRHVHSKRGTTHSAINLGGRTAEVAVRTLWPWLRNTDKGDQAVLAFSRASLPDLT